jgi:hypothetical protein
MEARAATPQREKLSNPEKKDADMAEGSRSATSARQAEEQAAKTTTREGIETAHRLADSGRRIADTITEQGGRTIEAVSRAGEIYRDATGATTEDMTALLSSYSVMAKGLQEMQRAWIETVQKSLQTSAQAPQSMLRWSTFSDMAQGHRDLLRESMGMLLESNARMLRIAGKIAEDAARPIEDRARR